MQVSAAQYKATGEFVELVAEKLGSGRAIQPETAIAGIARLAGSLQLRSFNLNLANIQPGTVVLSSEANEGGPRLVAILAAMLAHYGISLNKEMLGGEASRRGDPPHLSVVESLALMQDEALQITRRNGLELEESAHAAAMAAAFVVKECAGTLGAERGFNIASFGFVEGCKTAPPRDAANPALASKKRPWYKLW